jgi:hypothetical protein
MCCDCVRRGSVPVLCLLEGRVEPSFFEDELGWLILCFLRFLGLPSGLVHGGSRESVRPAACFFSEITVRIFFGLNLVFVHCSGSFGAN